MQEGQKITISDHDDRNFGDDRGFGLYIHWPFCLSKCPYCDFNSHVSQQIDSARWHEALLSELAVMAEFYDQHFDQRRPLSSLFFGGGTPSLMPPSIMDALISSAETHFGFTADIEITAEANPTSVETNKLADFKAAGINRISMGVQALDDEALRFLGRGHSGQEAITAMEKARHLFDRLSIDLIYGRIGQSQTAWREELSKALSFGLDHLSLYQLTIEQGTQFYTRHKAGEALAVPDDEMASLYEITEEMTSQQGLFNYEVSNYAAKGAQSRHNLIYWRTGDWLGIGPGAYGRLTTKKGRIETMMRRSPAGWLDQVHAQNHGIDKRQIEDKAALYEEIMMMGLRLAEGVPLSRLRNLCGITDWPFDRQAVSSFIEAGWMTITDDVVRLNLEGRLRLNFILQELLAE